MNTISNQAGDGRRRRRLHSDEFKADAVAACSQPGVSLAAVALSREVNANLLRRWVREAELGTSARQALIEAQPEPTPPPPAPFIPLELPSPVVKDIRVELRRGQTTVLVTWPGEAASECAVWIRELLR